MHLDEQRSIRALIAGTQIALASGDLEIYTYRVTCISYNEETV